MLEYKNYKGIITAVDEAQGLLHGEVVGINDVVTFQGRNASELAQAFRDSVDDYLEFCQELDEEPEKAFSGKVLVRMPSSLHRLAEIAARAADSNLNSWIIAAVQDQLDSGAAKRRSRRVTNKRQVKT